MLSYKQWKQVNESYDLSLGLGTPSSVGIQSDFHAILDEAKKKMKKKMFGDEEVPEDDEEEAPEDDEVMKKAPEGDEDEGDEDEDEEDAETGDGEVVDPASKKDVPEEDDEEEGNPLFARMKKMKGKMKKKMSAGKCEKKKKMAAETVDNDWMKSVFVAPPTKNFDGIGVTEDALLPAIDPNTGLYDAAREPQPGQVGFAPQGIVGRNF